MNSVRWIAVAICWLWLGLSACAKTTSPSAGTNTNWLEHCAAAADCAGAGDCLCGVCTLRCANDAPCAEVGAETSCAALSADSCGASASGSACLPECASDDDCDTLADGVCRAGHCVPASSPPSSMNDAADAGRVGTAGSSADAGADAAVAMCTADMRPALGVCLVSTEIEGLGPTGERPAGGLDLVITVLEMGTGEPPDDCFTNYSNVFGAGIFGAAPARADARWIRVEDEIGRRAVIGVVGPGFEWTVQVGSVMIVAYDFTSPSFSPSHGKLELRSQDGALSAWFGIAGTVQEVPHPPELSLIQGSELCRGTSQCIPLFAKHDLVMQIGDERILLSDGEQAFSSGFTLTHGGVDVQLASGTCADAFVAWAFASVWRTP